MKPVKIPTAMTSRRLNNIQLQFVDRVRSQIRLRSSDVWSCGISSSTNAYKPVLDRKSWSKYSQMTDRPARQADSRPNSNRALTITVTSILVIYWIVLFYATHMPLPHGFLPGESDKLIHFIAYGLLGVLLTTLRALRGSLPWLSLLGRWLFLAAYGALDEVTQLLVNRSCDLRDWLADITGAAIGVGVVYLIWYCCFRIREVSGQPPVGDLTTGT